MVGGEVKNAVLQACSNKGHDGYLGDAVIGRWCNLGAGTSNSNVKNNAGLVKMWNAFSGGYAHVDVKCGVIMGDYSKTAINSSLNTGTVIGSCCNAMFLARDCFQLISKTLSGAPRGSAATSSTVPLTILPIGKK